MNENDLGPSARTAEAYFDLRTRMIALLRSCDEGVAAVVVPHCPDWTVAMTISHMIGVPESIVSGDMADVTSEAWTARQVERHMGESIAELVDQWEAQSGTFDDLCRRIPQPTISQFLFDQVTHEHDVRWAMGCAGARDSAAVAVGSRWIAAACGPSVVIPPGLSDFEVLRCLSGRRSVVELQALGFDAAPVASAMERMPLAIPSSRVGD